MAFINYSLDDLWRIFGQSGEAKEDQARALWQVRWGVFWPNPEKKRCLLYTSDAADDLLCVDLGGRRIIKKKNRATEFRYCATTNTRC